MDKQTVMQLIDCVGPKLGYDYTYSPIFPENRTDVCAVNRLVENGNDYGYNVLYAVWEEGVNLRTKEIANTRDTKDYISVDSIKIEKSRVVIEYSSGGSFSCTPWKRTFALKLRKKI
jgi:hypothetical protein